MFGPFCPNPRQRSKLCTGVGGEYLHFLFVNFLNNEKPEFARILPEFLHRQLFFFFGGGGGGEGRLLRLCLHTKKIISCS